MKIKNRLLISSILVIPQFSHAMVCADVFEKAKPPKRGGKADCVLESHTTGVTRGSTVTVYLCGGTKYKLETEEDYSCTVSVLKK